MRKLLKGDANVVEEGKKMWCDPIARAGLMNLLPVHKFSNKGRFERQLIFEHALDVRGMSLVLGYKLLADEQLASFVVLDDL